MKLRYYIVLFMASLLAAGAVSCTKSESDDTREKVPPGPISNVRFTPDYGGGTIYYDIPSDEDFLYTVKHILHPFHFQLKDLKADLPQQNFCHVSG